MSKQQTAVEWFFDKLNDIVEFYPSEFKDVEKAYLQAKQMEKEQIIRSWHNGYNNQSPMIDEENCGNTYYQQTYGGDHD
jgi:hypothetical protein